MRFFLILTLSWLSLNSIAGTDVCHYSVNKAGSTLSWTAFKTPKKVGVKAKFSDFNVTSSKAASKNELLQNAVISINSQSVDSGDKGRDQKIMNFFFKKMVKGKKIIGKVLGVKDNLAQVELTMNGVSKKIDMKVAQDDASSTMTLTGKIDVLEFGMKSNLAAITKACYEKHEGVTWPDVELEFVAKLERSCK